MRILVRVFVFAALQSRSSL